LAFASRLPNFVADEVAKRYASLTNPPKWRLLDTVESEITFKGSRETREHIRVNGKRWDYPYDMLPGQRFEGGFGADLPALFNPDCPTTFELAGRVSEGGRSLSLIRFSSPPDGCVGQFLSSYQRFFAGETGRILLDERRENVMRFEANARGFPKAFSMAASETQVSWDYVKIGDETHLLPVSSDFITVGQAGGMSLMRAEYKNHRHFEASSNIMFH
jgi:hypothetical protein